MGRLVAGTDWVSQVDDVTLSMDFTIGRSMAEELPFMPGYDYTRMLKPDFYSTTKKDYFSRAAHGTITVKLTYLFDLKK